MPGIDGTGRLFEPLIPILRPHFNLSIVTYPALNSFQGYVDCALSQLPADGEFSLVAESFSGPVAIMLMSLYPDLIGPSVLAATFARSPLAELTRMVNYLPNQMFSIGASSEFSKDVYALKDFSPLDTQPLPINVTNEIDGAVLKQRCELLSRIDVSTLLPHIKVPILQLHGTLDRIVSGYQADILQKGFPNLVRVDIEAPHLLLQTQPRRCAGLIYQHINPFVPVAADS